MTRQTIIAAFVLAVACWQGAAQSATRYVNGTCGNDAWSGFGPVCAAPDGPKATIQAGINASSDGNEVLVADGVYTGPGNRNINFGGRAIVVRSASGPASCVIDCQGAGRGFVLNSGETLASVIQGFTVTNGLSSVGGAVALDGADASIIDCVFENNSAQIAAAIRHAGVGSTVLRNCQFSHNTVTVGAGAILSGGDGTLTIIGCSFTDNDGFQGPGAIGIDQPSTTVVNCLFARNVAQFVAGAVADVSDDTRYLNCVISGNAAGMAGGAEINVTTAELVNCTVSGNQGDGLFLSKGLTTLTNCIAWGNTPVQVSGATFEVAWSAIQGGWPGTGNIDADPLFVQPGTDDVRLSYGSPCVDAGNTAALPPDVLDLDGDGNTAEPMPVDLAGGPRVVDGAVDMGAYEGQFAPGAPASGENDLDQGELAVLIPEGGTFNPIESPAVLLTNVSGGDNASATVTQIDGLIHPGAGGYSDLESVLVLATSLQDGQFKATVMVPFDAAALGGAAPQQVRATWYDASAGNWAMAVWGNANASPGFTGPIGERIYAEAPGPWSVTQDVGDHGVFWDPAAGQGFAWANVDHASDFGVGIAPCPADCLQTPDGEVEVRDMLRLLGEWGLSAGISCDVDSDGTIGGADFAALLQTWGPCTAPVMPGPGAPAPSGALRLALATPSGSADLDASGAVDRADLELLKSCWGVQEASCPADLDGDGSVGVRDYLHLLAGWGQSTSP